MAGEAELAIKRAHSESELAAAYGKSRDAIHAKSLKRLVSKKASTNPRI